MTEEVRGLPVWDAGRVELLGEALVDVSDGHLVMIRPVQGAAMSDVRHYRRENARLAEENRRLVAEQELMARRWSRLTQRLREAVLDSDLEETLREILGEEV